MFLVLPVDNGDNASLAGLQHSAAKETGIGLALNENGPGLDYLGDVGITRLRPQRARAEHVLSVGLDLESAPLI